MNQYYVFMTIKAVIAIVIALILGNGGVVWFNHLPVRWFSGEDNSLPERLLQDMDSDRQRLPSTPWKLVFTVFFGACGVFLAVRESAQFMLAAVLVIFIVTMMATCDAKYRVVPDQLNVLLSVSAVGFVSFNDRLLEPLYHRTVIGGAHLKFYISIGFVTGVRGIISIFILIAVFALVHIIYLSVVHRFNADEGRPMLVYALPAVTLYMLALWDFLPFVLL